MPTKDDFTPPGYMTMYDTALEYLKGSRRTLYRELRKDKRLDDHIDGLIRATEDYAASLINGGEYPDVAWNRAIREHLLSSRAD